MMKIDYNEKAYFKNQTHNTMTERFVMSLPKHFTKKQHEEALKKTHSPLNNMFESVIQSKTKYFEYELMLASEEFMRLTFCEDVSARETESNLRIIQQSMTQTIPRILKNIILTDHLMESPIERMRDYREAVESNPIFVFHQKFFEESQ